MADFTAKDVQALRERTGVGMMECKRALTEAGGDIDKAVEILREHGLAAASKKASRVAAEGLVKALVDDNVGVVVEVNAETDFVAQNVDFIKFVDDIAQTVLENKPADIAALLKLKLHGSNEIVEDAIREKVLTIGENINIRRISVIEGAVGGYQHANNRIGVLVGFDADPSTITDKAAFLDTAKDVAMQVAALSAKHVRESDVPVEEVETEKKILTEQAINEGKPANIAEKMVAGRIAKFFSDIVLENQSFIKDGDLTIKQYLEEASKKVGTNLSIARFVRFEVGEGMEKRDDNFADEVASMIK